MLFQTLDDKDQCVGIYYDGKLIFSFEEFPQDLTRTWRYSPYLLGYRGVDYAEIYAQGKTLDEMCPEYLKEDWEEVCAKLKAFLLSFSFAKVNMRHNCFFDLVPQKFLRDYCQIKNQITNYVIESYPKPSNYKHLGRNSVSYLPLPSCQLRCRYYRLPSLFHLAQYLLLTLLLFG